VQRPTHRGGHGLTRNTTEINVETGLVTGTSNGIGLELTKLFAQDGYSLVLASRDHDVLRRLGENYANRS